MRFSTLLVGVVALFAVASSVPASAQTQEQIDWCVNKGNAFAIDLQISGCTASIQSGRWSGSGLAWAFNNRCSAYNYAGDQDRALTDCSQAIRLDPKFAFAYCGRGLAKRAQGDAAGGNADIAEGKQLNPNIGSWCN